MHIHDYLTLLPQQDTKMGSIMRQYLADLSQRNRHHARLRSVEDKMDDTTGEQSSTYTKTQGFKAYKFGFEYHLS